MEKLSEAVKLTLINAVNSLEGTKRRVFMAETVNIFSKKPTRKAFLLLDKKKKDMSHF